MNVWKALGLAGMVGVAATGALVVRSERKRRAYAPEEVRDRLHRRFAAVPDEPQPAAAAPRSRGQQLRSRLRFSRAR
ncbi:hypothetical protein CH306_22840 [Rhodococcus sp. 15-725-2-2b]|jgi:hypothetical protein|uniref:hypothetical protein n=1 Tax=Nocardiaceae TaxID=85025 RepID=UPI00050CA6D1|nr:MULTISPECIES: hypothetical protein [Rhodococcus]AJW39297.1 hypothetical protein NY08_1267 [Rhodococcus sp. B7740]OZC61017.1 hypothetical protein CH276_17230 [Rhodococcus sp. 06-470-2]OZC71733.1 hypothetical protein CH277_04275 [Rhodococcus sp. 06-469-3-2]OZD42522.1 hypothetical protein CH264_21690 [Rhodococcus sp. 06-1477-1A]OZD77703.1 hypothetical protein CH273_19955 [Rhodococcus sp. 05-339-2]